MNLDRTMQMAKNYVDKEVGHADFMLDSNRRLIEGDSEYTSDEGRYYVFFSCSFSNEVKQKHLKDCKPEEVADLELFFSEPTKIRVTVNNHRVLSLEWLNIDF